MFKKYEVKGTIEVDATVTITAQSKEEAEHIAKTSGFLAGLLVSDIDKVDLDKKTATMKTVKSVESKPYERYLMTFIAEDNTILLRKEDYSLPYLLNCLRYLTGDFLSKTHTIIIYGDKCCTENIILKINNPEMFIEYLKSLCK